MTTDNTAHLAPTPAPVAVPEDAVVAGLAARREYRENRRRADAVEIGVDEVHSILTAAAPHMLGPRPEPVVASSEADRVLGNIAAAHVEYGVLRAANPDDPALPPVVAPLPSEAVEQACEVMHDAYERAAVEQGWETQARSRKPWSDVPDANKATMRVAVAALMDHIRLVPEDDEDTVHCAGCDHPTHGDTDCGETVGYDHLNGDHECGCPGVVR